MQKELIQVVDTKVFQEELQLARTALPLAELFFTSKKNVAKFFKVHVNTITDWIEKEVFQEGVHYTKEGNKIIFIPLALLKHKTNPPKPQLKKEYQPSAEARAFLT